MKSGTSLIELLIAVAVISMILIALAGAASRSISAEIFSRIQAAATKQAEEQMERVRALRDRDGLPALSCADKCSLDADLNKSESEIEIENLHVWFQISTPGNCPTSPPQIPPLPNPAQVTTFAEWTDAKGLHQSKVVSCFSGWRG